MDPFTVQRPPPLELLEACAPDPLFNNDPWLGKSVVCPAMTKAIVANPWKDYFGIAQCSGDDAAERNVQFHLGLKHMPEEYMCLLHGKFALSGARTLERYLSSGGSGEKVDERVVPQVKPICHCGQRLSFRAILNDPTACDICMTSLREDDSFYQCSSPGKSACVHDFGCCQKCADC